MKRSIATLTVFKTPFENEKNFKNNFKKSSLMFEDYIINSWIPLEKEVFENDKYFLINYKNNDLKIEVKYFLKKDFLENDYFPAIILDYFIDQKIFEKENIESFLNDNIKFIFNVFFNDFFIEYDLIYKINDINKWKKVDYNALKKFNLDEKYSKENKQTLDSMMFLYYNLIKNIFEINKNNDNIKEILDFDNTLDLEAQLISFEKRQDYVKQNLIKIAQKLKMQIDTFLTLIK